MHTLSILNRGFFVCSEKISGGFLEIVLKENKSHYLTIGSMLSSLLRTYLRYVTFIFLALQKYISVDFHEALLRDENIHKLRT